MKFIKYFLSLTLFSLLVACGTSEVLKNPNTQTLSVTSKQGLINGGWDTAQKEATEKAISYCASMGQKYYYIGEQRSGTPGFTLLASTITFNCGADTAGIRKDIQNSCKADMNNPELDIIRNKVELFRLVTDNPPSFDLTTNNSYPTAKEKVAIAKWAKLREDCSAKDNDAINANAQPPANEMQRVFFEKETAFRKQMNAQIGSLIVALYQGKITYGEFAQKRYEMVSAILSTETDYRSAMLMQDRDAQMKAQQIAIQQQQNNIMAWGTYMQTVNARQPVIQQPTTTRLQTNCVTNKFGNTSTTNCN